MAPDAMGPATLPIRAKLVEKPTTIVRFSAGTAEARMVLASGMIIPREKPVSPRMKPSVQTSGIRYWRMKFTPVTRDAMMRILGIEIRLARRETFKEEVTLVAPAMKMMIPTIVATAMASPPIISLI